ITPKTNAQTLYTILLEILGAGMYGYVIGNIASLLANVDVARAQYLDKLEKVNTFMRFRKIPEDIQENIRNYYEYLWESRRGYDEAQVITDLPPPLKMKVALHLNRDVIEKVPIFKGASDDLIRQLVLKLQPAVYTPGDYVFRKGESGSTMFFIIRGSVEVIAEDGKTVYAMLTEGNFFGEIALLLKQPRTASVRAVEYCDLYTLDQDTFNNVIEDYPEFAHHVRQMARQRQQELGLEDSAITHDDSQQSNY
ncbi:MAG: cyclic nucleotide-binding domain-containing protein, partial [Leptospiraceae bacterium]|nr:cyclic nucleotide-binding domain-containing protein [Leptospiraceae bacterium]